MSSTDPFYRSDYPHKGGEFDRFDSFLLGLITGLLIGVIIVLL